MVTVNGRLPVNSQSSTMNECGQVNTADVIYPRRRYNQWVANETLEDFALRHTARRARRWSFGRVANTALGTSSFLVLELLGATIAISYGVYHSLWAIVVVCSLLFVSGLPVSYYASKYSVDIDLLTRGAGFGYIGSTISSLIYASFTFIFFALEAAIMASALEMLIGLPMWLGYIASALVVIPLVTHGISMISRFQLFTQPLWLLLQIAPIIYIAQHPDGLLQQWIAYPGTDNAAGNSFSWVTFGAATTVLFALVAQIGEQVDFLRFLPQPKKGERRRWWAAIVIAGPGWVVFGALKLVLGSVLAFLLLQQGLTAAQATDPTRMYAISFQHFSLSPQIALVLAALFVIMCQLKINVANAYAGSLAWSNFFSRLTHHHPGRVVWLVFNVAIALMLMELGVYRAIETVLHHYSAFVLAWFGSIVADLVINKPLGLSPAHIEFKRSKLYDINPVGVGSTLLATIAGFVASTSLLGNSIAAFSGFIAFFLPFITAPLIAWYTGGKYYLVPEPMQKQSTPGNAAPQDKQAAAEELENHLCVVCENRFDLEDMSQCPAYGARICSLCCALETRCEDQCRPDASLGAQLHKLLRPLMGIRPYRVLTGPVGQFAVIFSILSAITLAIFYLAYFPSGTALAHMPLTGAEAADAVVRQILATSFFLILVLLGVIIWLFVLERKSTRMALQETRMQTQRLHREIGAHKSTLQQLEQARQSADLSNQAKSNYVTALSHELRTPLNVILGYAQILQKEKDMPAVHQDSLSILRRNGEHLATMIEGLLEISKIEAGKLNLNTDLVRLDLMLEQLVKMFSQQAESKGLAFHYHCPPNLPSTIRVDEKRLRQILINLLSNAIKFTEQGSIHFSVKYRGHVARFIVADTGLGIANDKLSRIFVPFERGDIVEQKQIAGTGLGLAICRQLADMMGAEIEVDSTPGVGSTFTLLLQAAPARTEHKERTDNQAIVGYAGPVKTILVVDDNEDHRNLLQGLLQPLGFEVLTACDFASCKALAGQAIDLALLDVQLGSDSGWDIARYLRKLFERLPIVMVSANARGFYSDMPGQRIHDDYLEKPLQLDMLIEKLGDLLELQWLQTGDNGLLNGMDNGGEVAGANETTSSVDCASLPGDHSTSGDQSNPQEQLLGLARIGNLNGFLECLSAIKAAGQLPSEQLASFQRLARKYDFAAIIQSLESTGNRRAE